MARLRLEEVCELITDGTHQTPEYCDHGGVIFLSSKDVADKKINWDNAKRIPERLHEQLCKRLTPQKNDILLAKNGTTGVAAIVDREEIFDVYVSLAVLRPSSKISPKYLLYAINSPATKRQFNAGLKGIGVPNLHLNVIKNTELNFVDMAQQGSICKKLDKVTFIVYMRKKELEKLDTLIKARFVEMFGDPAINPNMYPIKTISEIAEYWNGLTYSPEDVSDEGIIVLRSCNIQDMQLNFKDTVRVNCKIGETKYVKENDILMCSRNGSAKLVGKVALIHKLKEPMSFGAFMMIIRSEFYPYLMVYFQLPAFRSQITTGATTTINQITVSMMNKIKVPVPDKETVSRFAAFVNQVDKTKLAVQKSLDEAQLLFDSLMQEYFG